MKFPKFKSDVIKIDTLIGKKTEITGDISGKGNYKIDGIVIGNITVKGDLIIGEKSVITGNIIAKSIIVAGQVTGDVEASGQLTIKHTGTISGDQKCGSLIVEEGSSVIGKCEVSGKTEEVEIPKDFMDIPELDEFENMEVDALEFENIKIDDLKIDDLEIEKELDD